MPEQPPRAFSSNATITPEGHLAVAGCDLADLTEEFGTPAYVVDQEDLRSHARAYVGAFERRGQAAEVVFASKSFPCGAAAEVFASWFGGRRSTRW